MEIKIDIAKLDEEERLVFGFFNINKIRDELVADRQDHLIPTEELEKAVYDFVLNARVQGERHTRIGVGRLVESFMITKQKLESISKCLSDQGVDNILEADCEGWFGGFKIEDEKTWNDVKAGKLPAFSIGGNARVIPVGE